MNSHSRQTISTLLKNHSRIPRLTLTPHGLNDAPRRIEYKPSKHQAAIHASTARNRFLLGPPGGGKTRCGVEETIRHIRHGRGNLLLIGPDFETLRDVMLLELEAQLPNDLRRRLRIPRSVGPGMIRLPKGRVVFLRSAQHPEGIPGANGVEFAWGDELDIWPRKVLRLVQERLDRPYPVPLNRRFLGTLTPELINGTSEVRDNYWTPHHDAIEAGEPTNSFFSRFTIHESKIHDDLRDELLRDNPEGTWGYSRLMAEWAPDPEGLIWPDLPMLGLVHHPAAAIETADELIAGVDCGHGHPFVWQLLGRHGKVWTMFADYTATGKNEYLMATAIAKLLRDLGADRLPITCYHDHDPNQMNNLAMELANQGIRWRYVPADKTGPNSIFRQLDFVGKIIRRKELQFHSRCHESHGRVASHRWKPTSAREGRDHENSHWPDALRYALWTHTASRVTVFLRR